MKFGKLLLIFALCLFSLIGCRASETKTEEPETGIENNIEETENNENLKSVSASGLPDLSGWSEVSHYSGDTDGDGDNESVVLMTSAERDSNGEIIWNDGQNWVMYVEDNGQNFVLLNKYIQAGNVYFEVLDYYQKDGIEPKINTIISTGTGFSIYSYAFDAQKSVYTEEVIYDTSAVTEAGTNRRFSSLSEI